MPDFSETAEKISQGLAGKSVFVLLIVVAMFVIVLVVIYIVSAIRKSKLRDVVLQDKIITLNSSIIPFKISGKAMALPSNGQEFSYSFWLYLNDQYVPTSQHKLLFQRGNVSDISNEYTHKTSPVVFMDKNTNKLYIALSTSKVNSAMSLDRIVEKSPEGRFVSGYMIGYIDYVPMQRWVNISFFVKDDKMFIFMDGDMYTAVSVSDIQLPTSSLSPSSSTSSSSSSRPVIRSSDGDATVGSKSYPIDGFLSYSRFFNYALTQDDVQALYKAGPTRRSLLSMIGLNNYGLRAPVYSLDDDAKNQL